MSGILDWAMWEWAACFVFDQTWTAPTESSVLQLISVESSDIISARTSSGDILVVSITCASGAIRSGA